MLPLALKGIIFVFRTRFKRSVMIISFVGAMTLLLAMREGNIGTLVRHRDQMTPYLIMFAAAGFIKRGTRSGDEL
jgi:hypothetical protein